MSKRWDTRRVKSYKSLTTRIMSMGRYNQTRTSRNKKIFYFDSESTTEKHLKYQAIMNEILAL